MPIEISSVQSERRRLDSVKNVGRAFRAGARAATLRRRRIAFRFASSALLLAFTAGSVFLVHAYLSYSKIVDARLRSGYLTSRAGIYAAPRTLRVGQTVSRENLLELLKRAGYVEQSASDVWSGSFTSDANGVHIHPRRSGNFTDSAQTIEVSFGSGQRIAGITGDGATTLDAYTLEPETLTNDLSMKTGRRNTLAYPDIPPRLIHAVLAIEDHRFFEHHGIDLFGIGRAFLRNAGENATGQGGSTITQQLVKNTYLSPEKTYRRKFAEALLAATLERRLSKEDIFALYVNEVYLGQREGFAVRGVAGAARLFFGKDLKDLSLAEAATIAGMIQSPTRYAPDRHADAAIRRRNVVLAAMLREGFITNDEATAAINEPLAVAPAPETGDSSAPYFVDYVNRLVESQLEAAGHKDERDLQIHTTIDLELQQLAETALKHQLEQLDKVYKTSAAKPQAALVALDPKTGNVLAMVGGRKYADTQLNRATDAARQPGSVFKPFVYTAAIESGLSPAQMYADAPREFAYGAKSVYRPANYGGAYSMRDVMMRTGLVKSLNVVTVDVALRAGLARVARTAESFGLPRPEPYPALALGTTEATPLQIACAYAAFANGGRRVEPNVIASASDASGANIIGARAVPGAQIIAPTTAYMITDMLTDVIDHGTARAARSLLKEIAVAGKTGTSRDGWFAGYTPNLVCVIWIGFDDNSQLGLTGAEAALPAWTQFIGDAVKLRPELGGKAFDRPEGIIRVDVDSETGLRATSSCPQRERIAVTSALAPNLECYAHSAPTLAYATESDSASNTSASTNVSPRANAVALNEREERLPAASTTTTLRMPAALQENKSLPTSATYIENYGRERPLLTSDVSTTHVEARRPSKIGSQ
jgi:penicillin-binding protein 1B